jgi:alkaline phosphatase D
MRRDLRRGIGACALALVLVGGLGGARSAVAGPWQLPRLTQGVAAGDVTATSAIIWTRASGPTRIGAEVSTSPHFRGARRLRARASAELDFTVTFDVRPLRPATRYYYRVRALGPGRRGPVSTGTFRTAPGRGTHAPVRFVFGGDVASGNYCRSVDWGLPIFFYMSKVRPDFFVALGDMIYADSTCSADGPGDWRNMPGSFPGIDDVDWSDTEKVRATYLEHWRYTRADRHLRYLLSRVPLYSMWDDHEVINDFGASWTYWNAQNRARAGYRTLVDAGRDALFAYGAIRRSHGEPNRIYRSTRWGRDVELFLLDARSYRSRNDEDDTVENAKTMLGARQLAWLQNGLRRSSATWKIVACDVPVTIPTGSELLGRDAWANGGHTTGFERELLDLLRGLDEASVRNVFFITADMHFAQLIRSSRDYDGDGDPLVFHEFVAGPLNARMSKPVWLDDTTHPTELYGDGGFFNFGYVQVLPGKGRPRLVAEVRDGQGKLRPGSRIVLSPR